MALQPLHRNNSSLSSTVTTGIGLMALILFTGNAFAHGMSEADRQIIADGGNLQYLWIGATHMLTGYDHLLFVFGIIFFLSSFRDIIKYVSAFTIGHSITLIYATFQGIQLNYYFIDAIIGLSVCYIAFANIDGFRKYLTINPPNMMLMIIALGLIHGLGLSSRLQELPLDPDSLLMNIISFNIGIELGQIIALTIMLPLISLWRHRHSFKAFSLIANYGLILAGGLLFLMQMHDYSHSNEATAEPTITTSGGEIATGDEAVLNETITVEVPPRGDIEYKILMKKSASLQYAWKSDGITLQYDFHGDPKGDNSGYFKSYGTGNSDSDNGSFSAPFEGKHGWYWKNSTNKAVHVQLHLDGAFQFMEQPLHSNREPTNPLEGIQPDSDFMNLEPAPAE